MKPLKFVFFITITTLLTRTTAEERHLHGNAKQVVVDECGMEFEEDGLSLVLKDNLKCRNSDGIKITASDITLNCKGHSVKGRRGGGGGYDGIIVDGEVKNVVIKNCVAERWPEDGIIVINEAQATIKNSKSRKNKEKGLRVSGEGSQAIVRSSIFNDNGKYGVYTEGEDEKISLKNVKSCDNRKGDIEIGEDSTIIKFRYVTCDEMNLDDDYPCDSEC